MKIFFAETGHLQHASEPLDYSELAGVGKLVLANIRNPEDLLKRKDIGEVLIIGRLPLPRGILEQIPNLKLIVKAGTGIEKIDLEAARELGIAVVNLSGYAARPVAQATMGFILAFASSLLQYDRDVRRNKWGEVQFTHPMMLLHGKRLGIIGLGGISRRVIELARNFGMICQVFTRYPERIREVEFVDLHVLARTSDFISIHCRLDAQSRGLVNAEFLSRVKKTAYLINTARAAVMDEQAIIDALRERRIAGLAIDGFWREPPDSNHELLARSDVIVTPHIAWAPIEIRQTMVNEIALLIRDFFAGKPRNLVNPR